MIHFFLFPEEIFPSFGKYTVSKKLIPRTNNLWEDLSKTTWSLNRELTKLISFKCIFVCIIIWLNRAEQKLGTLICGIFYSFPPCYMKDSGAFLLNLTLSSQHDVLLQKMMMTSEQVLRIIFFRQIHLIFQVTKRVIHYP